MSYQKLSKALNDSVKMYTPDVLYPRECLIVNVNENNTLKIKVTYFITNINFIVLSDI